MTTTAQYGANDSDSWKALRLRFACLVNPSDAAAGSPPDQPVSFLPMEKIGEEGALSLDETRPFMSVKHGFTQFRDDDVLVAKITPCFENGKGGLCRGLVNGRGFGTTELYVLRPRLGIVPRFLFYVTRSHRFRSIGAAFMEGAAGQQRVPEEFVRDFAARFPPESEQRAVASFLDRETAKVDTLVAKEERLIELVEEKLISLIGHAVTRGLDPGVPLKDTGIEWLGRIPTHWQVLQLRRTISRFVDYRGATPEKATAGIPLITAKNVKGGAIDFAASEEFIREEDYATWMVRGLPSKGDVLITTEAPLGEAAQVTDAGIALAQRIILLKVEAEILAGNYLKYFFLSLAGKGELWSRATGSTAIGIKASHLREIVLTVPPIAEQESIAVFLDCETTRIHALISKIREAIEKLREYRIALISAAVTGKIDVRDAAFESNRPIF